MQWDNLEEQAGFAVPHSSLTIGLVGLGLGWGWVGVGFGFGVGKKIGSLKNLGGRVGGIDEK